jgi:hypothetical protein
LPAGGAGADNGATASQFIPFRGMSVDEVRILIEDGGNEYRLTLFYI